MNMWRAIMWTAYSWRPTVDTPNAVSSWSRDATKHMDLATARSVSATCNCALSQRGIFLVLCSVLTQLRTQDSCIGKWVFSGSNNITLSHCTHLRHSFPLEANTSLKSSTRPPAWSSNTEHTGRIGCAQLTWPWTHRARPCPWPVQSGGGPSLPHRCSRPRGS